MIKKQSMLQLWQKRYFVLDEVLYYETSDVPGRRHLVVPEELREKIVSENHDIAKIKTTVFIGLTLQKLKQHFY